MKCKRQPRFLEDKAIRIANILEVRLAPAQWNRIMIAVRQRRRTYSTITRYCVLKLARKCSLRWTVGLRSVQADVKNRLRGATRLHRHMLCLYGEDEKLIRLAAMDLGLTLSAFIRLAIELYLSSLAMVNHSKLKVTDADLTAEGIRFLQQMQIFAANGGPFPLLRQISCIRYELESYW